MATRLMDNMYVKGKYLDSNVSVSSLSELIKKWDFDGQSVHMPSAFKNANNISYPIDFWYIPYGDDIKWEIKKIPSFESEEDFELFKDFINDFKQEAGYFPLSNGTEVSVNGIKYEVKLKENKLDWVDIQVVFDETIVDAVEIAVNEAIDRVTSGASEAFDTLKEIEEKLMWLPVEGVDEKHTVRHWRGTREKYEFLVKNNAVSDWTKYVVIDLINGENVITEYYGTNQVAELTGQLLPANSIIDNILEITPKPYDRYLVGSNGVGYNVYEYVIDSEGQHKWLIKPFDDRFGIRIKDKGLKNYIYVEGELITYDEVDCGTF